MIKKNNNNNNKKNKIERKKRWKEKKTGEVFWRTVREIREMGWEIHGIDIMNHNICCEQ